MNTKDHALLHSLVMQFALSITPAPQKCKVPNSSNPPSVILISGPTASGKTALAFHLKQHLDIEVVSADSMQVYRGMDIGTAKVSLSQREYLPHHLIDIRNLNERFNLADFYTEAVDAIEDILRRGKIPVVLGGTGFYFQALMYGIPDTPPANPEMRKQIEFELDQFGIEYLYAQLKDFDPAYAKTITHNDVQKICRAIEIIRLSGKKISDSNWKSRNRINRYKFHPWFIERPRDILYKQVEARCEEMMEQGFLQEVAELIEQGLEANFTASHSIGYRQAIQFLRGTRTPDEYQVFLEEFKKASRHYIKRQLTWFRHNPDFQHIDIETLGLTQTIELILEDFYSC